jgi:hypothetical protein
MLLSLSIINIFIIVLLGATLCAVITSITPLPPEKKWILLDSAKAMEWRWRVD